jgi:CheY-like chemotaxis protein
MNCFDLARGSEQRIPRDQVMYPILKLNGAPRVLVVDDNQDAAMSLAILLTNAGYKVETSFDGKAALEAADRFNPDVCVLDISMPGMNGYDLARQLAEKSPERPPLLATVTAYDNGEHLDRAVEAGFDLHFTKPADPRQVIDQLDDCLRRQPTASPAAG